MNHLLAFVFGAAASTVASLVVAIGVALTVGGGHLLGAWPWLFAVSVAPCALSALGLSLVASATHASRWRLHVAALVAGFVAVALAGSVGAIAVESADRGIERVNVAGYLAWCWIYAGAFLPLSYPIALRLQRRIHRLHHLPDNPCPVAKRAAADRRNDP